MKEELSTQLKRLRRERGLTLAQVARRAGTSAPALSRYERGWHRFELGTLHRIAEALDCEVRVEVAPRASTPAASGSAARVASQIGRLFWDRRLHVSDIARYPGWVIGRVLEYGNMDDVKLLIDWWGRRRFLESVSKMRFGSARTAVFWKAVLDQDGVPCTRKSFRKGAGNCWSLWER